MNIFNPTIKAILPLVPKPLVRQIAKPYIAGETLEELVGVVEDLNLNGFKIQKYEKFGEGRADCWA